MGYIVKRDFFRSSYPNFEFIILKECWGCEHTYVDAVKNGIEVSVVKFSAAHEIRNDFHGSIRLHCDSWEPVINRVLNVPLAYELRMCHTGNLYIDSGRIDGRRIWGTVRLAEKVYLFSDGTQFCVNPLITELEEVDEEYDDKETQDYQKRFLLKPEFSLITTGYNTPVRDDEEARSFLLQHAAVVDND